MKLGPLLRTWGQYREGSAPFAAVRLVLARAEIAERRRLAGRDQVKPDLCELTRLMGGASSRTLADAARALAVQEPGRSRCSREWIQIPRRVLRQMCRTTRPVEFATMLGHLIRCVWAARGGLRWQGLCGARWIASTFGVCVRAVRAARERLLRIGWLRRIPVPVWLQKRHGGGFEVDSSSGCFAPQGAGSGRQNAPLDQTRTPYGNLTPRTRLGFSTKAPSFLRILPEDLEPSRALELFEDACRRGFLARAEQTRQAFLAVVERAKRVARDPCAFVAGVVRRGLWHVLSGQDDDRAARVLRRQLYGERPAPAPVLVEEEWDVPDPSWYF